MQDHIALTVPLNTLSFLTSQAAVHECDKATTEIYPHD